MLPGERQLQVRVTGSEKRLFRRAANLAGLTVSAWARFHLRRAVAREVDGSAEELAAPRRGRREGGIPEPVSSGPQDGSGSLPPVPTVGSVSRETPTVLNEDISTVGRASSGLAAIAALASVPGVTEVHVIGVDASFPGEKRDTGPSAPAKSAPFADEE